MAVIKSSKIFISIRHPHATCIINAQPKDTTTTTFTTRVRGSPGRVCADEQHSTGRSRGQPDCILGRHCAAYAADVWCRSPWERFWWGNTILRFSSLSRLRGRMRSLLTRYLPPVFRRSVSPVGGRPLTSSSSSGGACPSLPISFEDPFSGN